MALVFSRCPLPAQRWAINQHLLVSRVMFSLTRIWTRKRGSVSCNQSKATRRELDCSMKNKNKNPYWSRNGEQRQNLSCNPGQLTGRSRESRENHLISRWKRIVRLRKRDSRRPPTPGRELSLMLKYRRVNMWDRVMFLEWDRAWSHGRTTWQRLRRKVCFEIIYTLCNNIKCYYRIINLYYKLPPKMSDLESHMNISLSTESELFQALHKLSTENFSDFQS